MVSRRDFTYREISGTTNAVADTQQIFRHSSASNAARPFFWVALEGDVYVPKEGLGAETIDVRSANTSEEFRILLIY